MSGKSDSTYFGSSYCPDCVLDNSVQRVFAIRIVLAASGTFAFNAILHFVLSSLRGGHLRLLHFCISYCRGCLVDIVFYKSDVCSTGLLDWQNFDIISSHGALPIRTSEL